MAGMLKGLLFCGALAVPHLWPRISPKAATPSGFWGRDLLFLKFQLKEALAGSSWHVTPDW